VRNVIIAPLTLALSALAVAGCGAPNPEEVCGHIEGVWGKDPEASKYKPFDKANCLSNGNMKKELPAYRTYAKCVKEAATIEAINVCAKAMDAALKG